MAWCNFKQAGLCTSSCHPLPSFGLCALHNVASTLEIGREFTLEHGGLMYTLLPIHFRVSGFAVCTLWPPDARSESKSPWQPMIQGPKRLKFSLKSHESLIFTQIQIKIAFLWPGLPFKVGFVYREKSIPPPQERWKIFIAPSYTKGRKIFDPKKFEVEKSSKCAQGHTTTKRSHAQKHSIHRKTRFCASNQRSFPMQRLVPKSRFVES